MSFIKGLIVSTVLSIALTPVVSFADGVMTPAAGPVPALDCNYRTVVCLVDEFWGGAAVSGSIGESGWNTNGGSITQGGGATNEPGLYTLATGGSSGTTATIYTQGSASVFTPGSWDLIWRVILGTNDANTTVHVGMQDSVTTVTPTNGSYFQKLDADTNWFCVTRAAGSETRTDSGVAVSTSAIVFRQVRTASSRVAFFINDVLVCSHTATIHATNTNAVLAIKNSAAANKTISTGYFNMRATVTR